MKQKTVKRGIFAAFATVLCGAVLGTAMVSQSQIAFASKSYDSNYYTDYTSLSDAQDAAGELNELISAEGNTLLKNDDNALPLTTDRRVSVFGVSQTDLAGGPSSYSGSVDFLSALKNAGLTLNPTLKTYYEEKTTADYGSETTSFSKSVKNSFSLYNDAAIVVITRDGNEGIDPATVMDETAKDADENVGGWEHEHQDTGYKHELQFTDSEVELLEYVKEQGFKKIIYVVNSCRQIEMYNIQNDPEVDAILWMGHPGETGSVATAKILTGEINPSGKLADTWYKDFTADPIWQNVGDNGQTNSTILYTTSDGSTTADSSLWDGSDGTSGMNGFDYEEDIYVGYRYYETRGYEELQADADSDWYEENVVYPFGYGLSYTSFAYSDLSVEWDDGSDVSQADAGKFASSVDSPAEIKKGTAAVKVTNTGSEYGKESVQLYVSAPYTGKVEKAHVTLIGFGKTKYLAPGESETLEITFNVQDMASYDALGAASDGEETGYVLEAGEYTIYAMGNAHGWADTDADDVTYVEFSLANTVYLHLDDYTDNEVSNQFSVENGMYYTLRDNENAKYAVTTGSSMTQLSRSDFEGTFPESPEDGEYALTDNMLQTLQYWNTFEADSDDHADGLEIEGVVDEDDYPWMDEVAANAERMSTWDQTGDYSIQLSELVGIDPYDTDDEIEDGTFAGQTGQEAWDTFMNTLTWEDLQDTVNQWQSSTNSDFGMNAMAGNDNALNLGSTFQWCDNPTLAATWNLDLAEQEGILFGNLGLLNNCNTWWGGAGQSHRSPFGGRDHESISEDGLLSGYVSAYVTIGAQSRGLVCYTKHFVLNDQETARGTLMPMTFVSEQALREIYLKAFQIAVQEGGTYGLMGSFNRVGINCTNNNYNLLTNVVRGEWGGETCSITTDAYIMMYLCVKPDLMVRAGTDADDEMSTGELITGSWDSENKCVVVGSDATESAEQWYCTRRAALNYLWLHINSSIYENGIDFSSWSVSALSVTQGVSSSFSVAYGSLEADSIEYSISSGSLPDGLSLSTDGTISGTVTAAAGTYTVTISCLADAWITSTKAVTLTVVSAFETDGLEDAKSGTLIDAFIYSDVISIDNGYDSVTYTLVSGSLPDGVELLEDGSVYGTPTESGTFTAEIAVAAGTSSSDSSGNVTTSTTTYTYVLSFTVAENDTEFTVTFETDGGSDVESQSVVYGNTAVAPTAPEKDGYTFTGWYTDSACTVAYDFDAVVTSDITLYAGWSVVAASADDLSALEDEVAALQEEIAALQAALEEEETSSGSASSGSSASSENSSDDSGSGCGSVVSGTAALAASAALAAACIVALRRKKDVE